MRRRVQFGFTLLEVLLALAIAGAMLAGLFSFHQRVLQTRKTLLAEADQLAGVRILMDRLTTELRGAAPREHFGLVLEGSDSELTFHYCDLPHAHLAQPQSDIKRVRYRLTAGGIERLAQDFQPIIVDEEQDVVEPGRRSQFEAFSYMSLRYWNGSAWVESWGGGDLPLAVEVTLGVEPLPQGVDAAAYPFATFRRVISVPAALHDMEGAPLDFEFDEDMAPEPEGSAEA